MNVLELWKNSTHKELRDLLAKALAQCDELREQMAERDAESVRVISHQKTVIASRDKLIAETLSVLDSFYYKLDALAERGTSDPDHTDKG